MSAATMCMGAAMAVGHVTRLGYVYCLSCCDGETAPATRAGRPDRPDSVVHAADLPHSAESCDRCGTLLTVEVGQ